MQEDIESVPGVASVSQVIVRPMNLDVDGEPQGTLLVGYDAADEAGGPLEIEDGADQPDEDELIIDEGYAQKAGLDVGDTARMGDRDLQVAGISSGGNFIFTQVSFVSLATARELLGMDALRTFFLIRLEEGADAEAVVADIEETFPETVAYTREEFATATREQIMDNMIPIIAMILVLAFAVGVAITGLTIYNATIEKQREYGILKAIGFTNGYLFRLVLEQSLATGMLGFVLGVVLTLIVSRFSASIVPQFVTLVRWQDIAIVLIATLLMSAIAALMPVRRLANVDPVQVFSS
jgi:putative ABC transport system permease protein